MLASLREMFDVMTFYKPIDVVVEEVNPVPVSLRNMFIVFVSLSLVSVLLSVILNLSNPVPPALEKSTAMLFLFVFLLLQVPVSSAVVFLLSRPFSSSGNLGRFVSVNYFLLACASIFLFPVFVPFAEFAGMLLFALGAILSLYFLEETIERMFGFNSVWSFTFLAIYVMVAASPFLVYFALTLL